MTGRNKEKKKKRDVTKRDTDGRREREERMHVKSCGRGNRDEEGSKNGCRWRKVEEASGRGFEGEIERQMK